MRDAKNHILCHPQTGSESIPTGKCNTTFGKFSHHSLINILNCYKPQLSGEDQTPYKSQLSGEDQTHYKPQLSGEDQTHYKPQLSGEDQTHYKPQLSGTGKSEHATNENIIMKGWVW